MYAAAEGHSTLGIPQSVGKEFVGKDAKAPIAAGIVFVAPDGDVLVLRRAANEENYAGHWALPGGKAEEGESAQDAATRESIEELGIDPDDGALLKAMDTRETPNGMVFHTFARPVDKKFQPKLNDEHSGYAWTSLDKLPAPLHPAVAELLGKNLGVGQDMTPEEWTSLRENFAKWTREEQAEGEHAQDCAMDQRLALDRKSVRSYDKDKRMHIAVTPISKANICEYYGNEIPDGDKLGLDPKKLYRLLRDPQELAKAASTFNNLPILSEHVPVTADTVDSHRPDLVIGSTGTDATWMDPYLANSMVIWAKGAINDVESNRQRELSSAYHYRADMTPGEFKGERYDGVMRDLVGNHVATVKEGRAGSDVVVGDSKPQKHGEVTMSKKIVLSRLSTYLLGVAAATLAPKLAQDQKIDITPVFKGVSGKNFKAKLPAIKKALAKATEGKLAQDASLDDINLLLDKLDGGEVEEGLDADPNSGLPMNATELKEHMAPEASDGEGEEDKGRNFLKSKLSAEDMAAYDEMMGTEGAEDEGKEGEESESDEENEGQEGKAARDAKAAKDAAAKAAKDAKEPGMKPAEVKAAMDSAVKAERDNQKAIREAERIVRPWTGELAMAFDSAEGVYKKALEIRGVKVDGVHPSAYRTILELQPKPGAAVHSDTSALMAMDASTAKGFESRFPKAGRIGHA
jgi:8-oxo-dGTP pyrophosphatase MutT (NUDIX family)